MKRVMAVILSATTIFGTFPVGVNASVVEKAEGNVATFTSSGEGNNIKSDNDYNSQELLVATNEDFANLEGMLKSLYSIKDKDFDSSTAKFEYVFYPFITQGYSSCGYEYFFGEDGEELNYTFNGEAAKPDPKNRLYFGYNNIKDYCYYKLDADNVDWISKNIYNVEPDHSLDVYGDMGMYYYDGDYYIKSGDAGYIGHTADILDYKKLDNGKYYVTIQYSMEYDGINKNYMLVGLKNINGKKYWSVYKNSLNPFDCDDIKPITVTLNGNKLTFSENPYIENGTTMVPMRAIFEALGASVDYDTETKAITATKGSTVIKLFANSDTATVNGKEVTLTSPVANKNGTTMVPLRLVSEALGAEVSWDAESKTINISISEKNTKEETSTIKLNELDETYSGEIYDYEKNYIEAHQKFINSDDYKNITSYACAEEIGNGIKNDSKIQNAKLGNHAVHLFKDYFKNYYDIALADVLIKQSTYDKYELMFKDGILKNQKSICDDIINIVKDDWGNDFSKKDESIIRKILTTKNTEDYANDPIYTKLSSILEKHMNQEQITNIFNATGKVSNAVELFNKASNIIDAVQNTMNYSSALNAYLDTSDEFKKVLVYTDINPALKYKNGVDYALLHESINRYLEIYNEENVAKEVANKALYEGVVATYSIFKDEWINSIGNFIYTSAAISGSEAAVSAAVGKVTGAITIGYEIGTAISDVLFKNNEKVALLSTLEANGFLAENAKKALDSAESEFLKNPSYENAKIFDEAFNFYKGIQIYLCDKAIEYDKQIKGLLNIFKWKSLDENIKFAEETKKEYEDLYCH